MVGAMEIGDFAWRVEELLNRLGEQKIAANSDLLGCVTLAVKALPELKARMLQGDSKLDSEMVQQFGQFARNLARGEGSNLADLQQLLPAAFLAGTGAESPLAEAAIATDSSAIAGAASSVATSPEIPAAADAELAALMMQEIRQYSGLLKDFISRLVKADVSEVDGSLVRAIHTLASTMAISPLGQEAEVARSLEHYLERQQAQGTVPGRDALPTLQTCLHRFLQRLFILEEGHATSYPLEDAQLLADLQELRQVPQKPAPVTAASDTVPEERAAGTVDAVATAATGEPGHTVDPALAALDATILAIFLEEAHEVLERCDTTLNSWRDRLTDLKLVQNLQREIHTFKGGARMAGLEGLGDLSHAMESLLERIAGNRLQATVAAVQALEEGCDSLTVCVDQLVARQMPDAAPALQRFEQKVRAVAGLSPTQVRKSADKAAAKPAVPPETAIEKAAPATSSPVPASDVAENTKIAAAAAKGSRKSAGKTPAAAPDAGSTEPVAASISGAGFSPAESSSVELAQVDAIERPADSANLIIAELAASVAAQEGAKGAQASSSEARRRSFREVPDPSMAEGDDNGSQPQIRVAAELMDTLVNYAGEISIYRARLEQQLGTVRFNLKEVEQTIGRLKEQLRKMDGESEAQMLSRYQNAAGKGASDFDPLELDRFSNMQQLSRAITESISDLMNLQEMLGESVRQAETLLVQQSRVSTDLQEGLMQTRMTPFGSAAPRLRRVVRAAATETGKRARLQLRMAGSSDQLDRNVLERITAPLEHMLRNAVVHGIETPRERIKAGKPEEGEIIVTVEAEATEFVLRVEDDGNGVNLDAVRKRAIERGLMKKHDDISEQALTEFILESGFSTATTVTGLAGRGVGMDVVNSEIKQIGGSIDIDSH
ncbi:MAG TPA: Hpt domain-containing protein, partial [Xanthomonadales bacterium]|nr:Hpt domain-containing protein [Xanthomonadales bacterium]